MGLGAAPLASTAVLFVAMASWFGGGAADARMSTGDFIAFSAAFGTLMASGLSVARTLAELVRMGPCSSAPLLSAAVETTSQRPDLGKLSSRIEAGHLRLRHTHS